MKNLQINSQLWKSILLFIICVKALNLWIFLLGFIAIFYQLNKEITKLNYLYIKIFFGRLNPK
jgi:cell division protein FtsL